MTGLLTVPSFDSGITRESSASSGGGVSPIETAGIAL